ncbi:RNA binding protein [Aureococcus anophagefferens]|uniref:RNA binding protein n=1 Tax=Aureococcus anophagefferens TaxID=44056 RepID=A0ABR1G3E2_AURAN
MFLRKRAINALTFDEPASFSAAAAEYTPASRRPASVVISGLPLATAEQDVRHVFSANAYGDVAAVHKWRDQHRPESSVRRRLLRAVRRERARAKLSPGSRDPAAAGVTVDFSIWTTPTASATATCARDALDRLSLAAPPGRGGGRAGSRRDEAPPSWGLHAEPSSWGGDGWGLRPEPSREPAYGLGQQGGRWRRRARTTLMVRNIPNKYTQKAVLEELDVKFANTYDFFYLPIDFKNKCNVGYAFINLVCAITYARIQGKQAMIQRFQNSSLLNESLGGRNGGGRNSGGANKG